MTGRKKKRSEKKRERVIEAEVIKSTLMKHCGI